MSVRSLFANIVCGFISEKIQGNGGYNSSLIVNVFFEKKPLIRLYNMLSVRRRDLKAA
jgi:hypothetical protein